MTYLTLVRHGQSQWNLENRFTGWTDVPLTEAGRREAERAGHLLHDIPVDSAFTSALQRAHRVYSKSSARPRAVSASAGWAA